MPDVANPRVIRDFMICSGQKLPNAAKHRGVKPSIASVVREHWMRRITGRCVQCGYYVKGSACPNCKTSTPSPISFLTSLSPDTELIRCFCRKCHDAMVFTAGDVLKSVKKSGRFNTDRMCRRCYQESRRKPDPKKVSRWQGHETVKKPKKTSFKKGKKRVQLVDGFLRRDGTLRQRPFLALEGLKIEKVAPPFGTRKVDGKTAHGGSSPSHNPKPQQEATGGNR